VTRGLHAVRWSTKTRSRRDTSSRFRHSKAVEDFLREVAHDSEHAASSRLVHPSCPAVVATLAVKFAPHADTGPSVESVPSLLVTQDQQVGCHLVWGEQTEATSFVVRRVPGDVRESREADRREPGGQSPPAGMFYQATAQTPPGMARAYRDLLDVTRAVHHIGEKVGDGRVNIVGYDPSPISLDVLPEILQ